MPPLDLTELPTAMLVAANKVAASGQGRAVADARAREAAPLFAATGNGMLRASIRGRGGRGRARTAAHHRVRDRSTIPRRKLPATPAKAGVAARLRRRRRLPARRTSNRLKRNLAPRLLPPRPPPPLVLLRERARDDDVLHRALRVAVLAKRRRVRLEVAQLVLDRLGDDRVVARGEAVVVDDRLREDLWRDDGV